MYWNKYIFELKNKLANRGTWQAWQEALRYDRLAASERKSMDWQMRKAMVETAYEHSPYYREKYDAAGFHPSQLELEADWALVPLLEKREVRHNARKMLSGITPPPRLLGNAIQAVLRDSR